MDVTKIGIDREQAKELYQAYKAHQQYGDELDREIQRTYRLISQGRVIIQALESIKHAGLNEQGLPNLAIGRADLPHIRLTLDADGSAVMESEHSRGAWRNRTPTATRIIFQAGSFAGPRPHARGAKAVLPIIPIHLRPKQAISAYHVLWEAEWTPVPPRDPYLLRRVGKGDLWLVCAAWDLTEVERAAMATRISAA